MIYLDNAATTQTDSKVLEVMLPYFAEYYGNPAAIYSLAGESGKAVAKARTQVADLIHAKREEIYFTGGGSEADNWALKAVADAYEKEGCHIITTRIEHHAVLHTCEYLQKKGCAVTYVDVDSQGYVSPEAIQKAIRPDTRLISVMAANNEIGSIQPLQEIGSIAKEHHILFHTDAVQAFGHIPLNVEELQVDMLSASGHKLHGPKGVGILYLRRNVKLGSFIHGGAQERHRRAGTHNVPAIVGMGMAAELAGSRMEESMQKESKLRDYLIEKILTEVPGTVLTGGRENRLPNNASFCFEKIEGESLLILLNQKGICASGGSACSTGAVDPSHVLEAIGVDKELAKGALRLTVSSYTTREELDEAVESIKQNVERLRSMRL